MPPLSGVQVLAPTFWGTSENYWLPALACAEYATTNPNGLNRNTGLFAETSCAGQMTLQRVHRNNQLNLEFTGAGFFDNRPFESGTPGITKQYGPAANLAIVEQVNGRKWNLMLADQGTYLPEGSMGYTEFAGLSTFAGGMGGSSLASAPALNSAFSPNQSIYGGYAERLSNLSLSEFQYSVGPRTILTATGTFGTQQFLTSGYIDQRYWSIMTGYNRTFGRSNEVALAYDEMHYNFGPTQPGFLTRGASILYGRQISSRVSIQLSVAPMARETPVLSVGPTTSFYLGTYNSLRYRALRWDGAVGFDRTMTGGAGFLAGSERSEVTGSLGRQLSRRLHGSLNAAYANNLSIAHSVLTAPRPSYDYVLGGANLTHELRRHISLYLNYSMQRETSNTPLCNHVACSTVYFRQIGGFGINWHAQPMRLE